MEKIGITIKTLRKRYKIVQADLARKIGISQSYLSLIERGGREPSLTLIKDVASVLNIPEQMIYLMSWDAKNLPKKCVKPFKSIVKDINEILQAV